MRKSPLMSASAAYLRDLDRQANDAVRALLRRYEPVRAQLLDALERLAAQMETLESPTKGQLYRLDRYTALLEQVAQQMSAMGGTMSHTLPGVVRAAAGVGVDAAAELAYLQSGYEGIKGAFTLLNAADMAQAVSFIQPASPLMQMLVGQYGQGWAEVLANQYVSGVALGWSPLKIVAALRQSVTTAMPADLDRIIRTAQIWGYRETNARAWQQSGVVDYWTWSATLDDTTCFPADTLITTARGVMPIQHIRQDDKVLTHTGKWCNVARLISRDYTGQMVTIKVSDATLTCTSDHPLLCERHGKLEWVRACDVTLQDRLVRYSKYSAKIINHGVGSLPVERRSGNAQHSNPTRLQPQIAPLILADNAIVPVGFVNLNSQVTARDIEVYRVFPDSMLLNELDVKCLKTQTGIGFRFGFSFIAAVAHEAAEASGYMARLYPELLFAIETNDYIRRASAFLGAMTTGFARGKNFAASLACSIYGSCVSALHRTHREFTRLTRHALKRLPAYWTNLFDVRMFTLAQNGTVFSRAIVKCSESLAAPNTGVINGWLSNHPPSAVRVTPLMFDIAGCGTKDIPAFSLPDPRAVTMEVDTAILASEFDLCHVSSIEYHAQNAMVYNLTVEEDHSFIANGFVVHNCGSCWAMHGTRHPITETLNDHHRGRCAALPHVAGNEFYQPVDVNVQSGETLFRQLSTSEQQQIAKGGGWGAQYQAWKDGKIKFEQMSTTSTDAIYGEMRHLASLKSLL